MKTNPEDVILVNTLINFFAPERAPAQFVWVSTFSHQQIIVLQPEPLNLGFCRVYSFERVEHKMPILDVHYCQIGNLPCGLIP